MGKTPKKIGKRAEERVRNMFLLLWNLQKHCVVRNIASGTYEQEFGDLAFHLEKCGFKNPHLVVEVKRRKYVPLAEDSSMIRRFLKQLEEEASKYYNTFLVNPSILLVIVRPYERDFTVFYKLSNDSNLLIAKDFPKIGRTKLRHFLQKVRPIPQSHKR